MSRSFSLGSVNVKLPPTERFAQFLQGRGKRITQQRRLIVETVFSHHDHFDADELIEHLPQHRAFMRVSRHDAHPRIEEEIPVFIGV